MDRVSVAIVSDIHYACAAERARGNEFELRGLANPLLRSLLLWHRRYVWLRDPLSHNHLLDSFIRQAADCDLVVANGDYTCNTGFVGIADDPARESVRECLTKLQDAFDSSNKSAPRDAGMTDGGGREKKTRFRATIGDHELGKMSFVGKRGGMRLASWRRAREELGLEPFWQDAIGRYRLIGVTSSIVALPVFEADTLPDERHTWHEIRREHMEQIREAFGAVGTGDRVVLFCHDPTALPFLLAEEAVRARLPQLEMTIIGHLHTQLVLRLAWRLAGMPQITWLGHTARRLSTALGKAKHWRVFNVQLCPSLSGSELLKDGGWGRLVLDRDGKRSAEFVLHKLWRE